MEPRTELTLKLWLTPEEFSAVEALNEAARIADLELCEKLVAEWAAEDAAELGMQKVAA